MKFSGFVFDYDHLLYYKCHTKNPNCGWPYIDSPGWIKNKKATINPVNNKHFQCDATVTLNHDEITNVKPFMNKYNWKWINFASEKDDFCMFCMPRKKKYILSMFQNITQTMKNKLFF